jgi:hypothetical protein
MTGTAVLKILESACSVYSGVRFCLALQEGVVPCNAQPENSTGGEITNFGGSAPIAVTDLTRTSPPKFARVAIEHPPPTAQPVPEYEGAPHPKNEEERQDYLCALNVLDTPADSRFDDITKLVRRAFGVPTPATACRMFFVTIL